MARSRLVLLALLAVVTAMSIALAQRTSAGTVDPGPPCVDNRPETLATTSDPPPAELTAMLRVLRRPQRPADRIANVNRLAALPITGVNPDAIRLASNRGGLRIYLVPAQNVRYVRPLPDTPGCKRFVQPDPLPAAGVCLVESGSDGGATCNDTRTIRRGLTMMTGGGRRHGFTHVAGIAPDGVRAVIWRVHRGKGFLDTRIAVHGNVYAASVPGRAGHGLYVYFVTAKGRKLVRGPHHFTKRELRQLRRERVRDEAAGPKPTIFPPRGSAKTLFTLRMRPRHAIFATPYFATWTGPPGSTCQTGETAGAAQQKGPLRGLVRAAFGPPGADGSWCPGAYSGTVKVRGHVVGRFAFSVR